MNLPSYIDWATDADTRIWHATFEGRRLCKMEKRPATGFYHLAILPTNRNICTICQGRVAKIRAANTIGAA